MVLIKRKLVFGVGKYNRVIFRSIEKGYLIFYFIAVKIILSPNATLLNLSLFIFIEHHYFGIFQLCLLGTGCHG